ncbi:MAG: DUF3379 domain-containing protein, partial [Pseudomonadota bacterium]|nr:DUF3379 domain-containing protein [Pseudomonadota bacterium]
MDFRRRVGAEPALDGGDIAAHRRDCPACAHYQDELRTMDGMIARALALDVARIGRKPEAVAPAAPRRRLFAIAASIAVGLAVGLVLLV